MTRQDKTPTHAEILSGSYVLKFRTPSETPLLSPIIDSELFRLWSTTDGFIVSCCAQNARFGRIRIHCPFIPAKVGNPRFKGKVRKFYAFSCLLSDARPINDYAPRGTRVFLSCSEKSYTVSVAMQKVYKAMFIAKKYEENILRSKEEPFWRPFDREIWAKYHCGSVNYLGHFYRLKKDETRYRYVSACSTDTFNELYHLSITTPLYSFFSDFCNHLSIK